MSYPKLVENLIEQLIKLPGVGRRSAERMVFWFLNNSQDEVKQFAESIMRLKLGLAFCRICNNLCEGETCAICNDPRRARHMVCVVEAPKDLLAIERTGSYKGLYHVLLGVISPAEGRGPDDLKVNSLLERIRTQGITEVVIATDPDTDGEMTSLHLINLLRPLEVKISRIGLGIPVGSSVEYADMSTLTMSLNCRREITS